MQSEDPKNCGSNLETSDVSSPMFPAAEVDDLLAMFDNVYEDAFFKTWDDIEVKMIPVLFLLNSSI